MKIGVLLLLVIASGLSTSFAYSISDNPTFEVRLIPSKLVEGNEGMIQVNAVQGTNIIPKKMTGLTVTSLDSSILRVIDVKHNSMGFASEISVKAGEPGKTKLFFVAPGFSSFEFPVTVYGNKLTQEKLIIKTVPNSFYTDGPDYGFVSVSLADEDGFPTKAKQDTVVTLETPSSNVINLVEKNLIIKKGEYFAIANFIVNNEGKSKIFAYSNGIESAESKTITVNQEDELRVNLLVFPKTVNSFGVDTGTSEGSGVPSGYIIGILEKGESDTRESAIIESTESTTTNDTDEIDDLGEPVTAKKDILVKYKVTTSKFAEAVNRSTGADLYQRLKSSGSFYIKEGTSWGYAPFVALSGVDETYKVILSSDDPLSVDSEEVKAVPLDLLDDKIIKFETIPILATGNRELVGIVHLEDENGNPIRAETDLEVHIGSSNNKFLIIENPIIEKGLGFALVFGKTGSSVPPNLELFASVDENKELIEVELFGPQEDSLQLKIEPLVPGVLSGTEFPMIAYVQDGDRIIEFPKNPEIFFTPNGFVELVDTEFPPGGDYMIINSNAIKPGSNSLNIEIDDFNTQVLLENLSTKPASLQFDHSSKIFVGQNDLASIQILNAQGSPIYASEDIQIKVIQQDQNLIDIPSELILEKGQYKILFDMAPKKSGETEITVMAKDLPITTTKIKIVSLAPELEISGPDLIDKDDAFDVVLKAKYNNEPLAGAKISWNVNGGLVQISDEKIKADGMGTISMIGISEKDIKVEATVSSESFTPVTISKTIKINQTSLQPIMNDGVMEEKLEKPEIFGIDPILFLVPAIVGSMGFMLKKKGMKIKQ